MNEAGFDASRWDHWLLVISAVIGLSYALWLSWRWNWSIESQQHRKIQRKTQPGEMRRRNRRQRSRVAERLRLEISKAEQRERLKSLSANSREDKVTTAARSRDHFLN